MAAKVIKGIADGDPEILDAIPTLDLSRQWADGPTERGIVGDIAPDWELDPDHISDLVDVYRDAWDQAVVNEVQRMCEEMLDEDDHDTHDTDTGEEQ